MNTDCPTRHRLLLAEDHPATRAGVAACLGAEPDLEVCGQTDSWRGALVLVQELRPDAILLDLQLRDGTGWALLEALSATQQLPPTLVFSVFPEEVHAVRLLRAGARGYLPKETPLDRVVAGVRKLLSGHLVISDWLATRMLEQAVGMADPARQEPDDLRRLSDRELQVLQMLSQRLSSKQIAERLGLSVKTVATYKARLMEKLGASTTPELERLADARLANGEHREVPGHR